MKDSTLLLPAHKNYEYGYDSAYRVAGEQLAQIRDIRQQSLNSGAQYREMDSRQLIVIEYLNRSYHIVLPGAEVSLADSQEEVPIRNKLLILHYFIRAKGTPLSNQVITYKELPEGANYFPTFAKRAIRPLLGSFGEEPERLIRFAPRLGGHEADYGDVAVTIDAFPRVPITIVLWRGDAEFAPEGNILFDSTISDYLSAEDINVLCETISWSLVRFSREGREASS